MPDAVILLSGGLDATATPAFAKAEGFTPCALSFGYGQQYQVKLESAARVAAALGVAEHVFADIDLGRSGGSVLTADIELPKDRSPRPRSFAAEIIRKGIGLGVDDALTSSCYDPDSEGRS